MPIRPIPPNGRSVTGRLVLYGTNTSLAHESLLERDCLLLLSFDPDVQSIEVQPVRINYRQHDDRGRARARHYTPDVLVRYHARSRRPPTLIEVKYVAQLKTKRAELLPKIHAGYLYARERGWRYRVHTDRLLRDTPLLGNVKFLRPFLRHPREEVDAVKLLTALRDLGPTDSDTLLKRCAGDDIQERARLLPSLWRLLAGHEVGADLRAQQLSMSTPLWPLMPKPGSDGSGSRR